MKMLYWNLGFEMYIENSLAMPCVIQVKEIVKHAKQI